MCHNWILLDAAISSIASFKFRQGTSMDHQGNTRSFVRIFSPLIRNSVDEAKMGTIDP